MVRNAAWLVKRGWQTGETPLEEVAMRIELEQGDITAQRVDAIVNAANSSLMGGGGVDGAIHRKGGPEIVEACKRHRAESYPEGLPAGRAVATTAGRLPAKWVIHTVGPVYSKSEDRSALLASCHTEALRVADDIGARTVAFPAISTGVYGYPLDLAAPVAIRAVREAETGVEEVRFVLFDHRAYRAFEQAMKEASG
jgi:O-acetyl-ADP-ribose deacetylase (regulator of RNase III)